MNFMSDEFMVIGSLENEIGFSMIVVLSRKKRTAWIMISVSTRGCDDNYM